MTFAGLLPLVNPFAALPLFASLTQGTPAEWRKQTIIKTSIFVFIILVVTEYAGTTLLSFFGLSLGMLQIAGGLIVGHTAWMMSTDTPKITHEQEHRIKRSVVKGVRDATVHAVSTAVGTLEHSPDQKGAGHKHHHAKHSGHADASAGNANENITNASGTSAHQACQPSEIVRLNEASEEGAHPAGSESAPAGHSGEAVTTHTARPSGAKGSGDPGTESGAGHPGAANAQVGHPAAEGTQPHALPDISFSPMAMPMLAGPGAMGVVVGIVAHNQGAVDSLGIMIGIAGIALLSLIVLAASSTLNRVLGSSGVLVMQRIFGFITLGIAVALVATGVSSLFGIPIVN